MIETNATNGPNSRDICFRDEVKMPSTTYATYSLYKYPAKFIPQIVAYVMENYAKPKYSVFDPFAGYGTVGVISRVYGHDYELWDLNPVLKHLHGPATMKYHNMNTEHVINEIRDYKKEFIPDWSGMDYWFADEIYPLLKQSWGYYHSQKNQNVRKILTIPLLKASRYFSYDDPQRGKLSKSPKSKQKIEKLLAGNWQKKYFSMLTQEIKNVQTGINEYWKLPPKQVQSVVRAPVDSFSQSLENNHDILITSPPYLQSQEYIRQSKLDLFWLGEKESEIKRISKLEMPYREIPQFKIESDTYLDYHKRITKSHLKNTYSNYFKGVLGTLSRLGNNITHGMFLFVGRASMDGISIPLDTIFAEHFVNSGWKHEITLVDTIPSRRMFNYKTNPATGKQDARTSGEYMVILKKMR